MPADLTLALHLCRGNLPKGVEGNACTKILRVSQCRADPRKLRLVHMMR